MRGGGSIGHLVRQSEHERELLAKPRHHPARAGEQTDLHSPGLAVGYSSDSGVICSTSATIARRTFGSRTRVYAVTNARPSEVARKSFT